MNHPKRKILTWHVHGNYLYYLSQIPGIFYIPVKPNRESGYIGKTKNFPWGENGIEVPYNEIKNLDIDCVIFQSNYNPADPEHNFLADQEEILSEYQKTVIPHLFIEHDTPRHHPTDMKHILYNSDKTLIHVTHFNELMWNSGTTRTHVIEHGVTIPSDVSYIGEKEKGVVVINNLSKRGRRLGLDIFEKVRKEIPLDLIGMGSEELGGLGEIRPTELPHMLSSYRFFFSPIRYTSLSLSILEAMMVGLPVIGLATTELVTIIENGKNGYVHTDLSYLISRMKELLTDQKKAKLLGENARRTAENKFSIKQFAHSWERVIEQEILQKKITNANALHDTKNYAITL